MRLDTSGWLIKSGWAISPGVAWCAKGNYVRLGNVVTLAIDMGVLDGYRRCLHAINGVAYINSGCWTGTLDETTRHWETHTSDRRLSMLLLPSLYLIAKHLGLKTS